jgi:hypothetical protein
VLRFDVSQFAGAGAYVEFEVTEFDAFSYLFCRPTLVNAPGARVANLRIAVNGQVPVSGQAFASLDTVAGQTRQELSQQCSIIAQDQGPLADVFHLEFEYLGPGLSPDEGLRTFARLNETMGTVTGVDPNAAGVRAAYTQLEQALPGDVDLRTFASAQQMAISNLALEYCDALVETPALRDAFFGTAPPFEFDQPVAVAFSDPTKRALVIDALHRNLLGSTLASQPSQAELASVLDPLITTLTAACTPITCDATRTRTVVKAACAAVLSSAAVTVH